MPSHPRLLVMDSSIYGKGEWIPNYDDGTLVSRLGMVFDMVEDCLEFYKRYTIYVGFSIHNDPTRKNTVGRSWKRYVCTKERFHRPVKMLEIAKVVAEAMPKARDGHECRKLRRK